MVRRDPHGAVRPRNPNGPSAERRAGREPPARGEFGGLRSCDPAAGESFSEFYLLTENQSGSLTAEDYPTNFTEGEGESLVVGVTNHEHQPENYTVVSQIQRVRVANNSTTVLERNELQRFDLQLANNETWTRQHTVAPTMTGERLRLVYLLYRGSAPANPTTENAYRETHLWVNVTS